MRCLISGLLGVHGLARRSMDTSATNWYQSSTWSFSSSGGCSTAYVGERLRPNLWQPVTCSSVFPFYAERISIVFPLRMFFAFLHTSNDLSDLVSLYPVLPTRSLVHLVMIVAFLYRNCELKKFMFIVSSKKKFTQNKKLNL
jgi:hypothetical protein